MRRPDVPYAMREFRSRRVIRVILIAPAHSVRPAQSSALEWKSRTALTSLDQPAANGAEAPGSDHQADPSDPASLAEYLCYSCLTMFTPSSNAKARRNPANTTVDGIVPLPDFISQGYVRRSKLDPRSQISQFLLCDDQAE